MLGMRFENMLLCLYKIHCYLYFHFIQSFISKHFLSTYYVPDSALGAKGKVMTTVSVLTKFAIWLGITVLVIFSQPWSIRLVYPLGFLPLFPAQYIGPLTGTRV